jgi:hypothetical protein
MRRSTKEKWKEEWEDVADVEAVADVADGGRRTIKVLRSSLLA